MATPTTAAKSRSSLRRAPSSSSSTPVRVVVRIRPFLPSEIASGFRNTPPPTPCISLLNGHLPSEHDVTVHIKDQLSSRNECYKLDAYFGPDDNLHGIFEREVSPIIPVIFRGLNATVFAYGATGSGKTYAMQGTDEHPGFIPQAMSTIFDKTKDTGCSVEISYYEIYLDRCYDLLQPKAQEIPVLEDGDGNVRLKGLSLVRVHSMAGFIESFTCGVQRRKVARTGLNDASSRSHGVLSIVVSDGDVKGKLNLIDLAGNEDNRRACNEGIRFQESAKINQSLFALSNVIYALNNNEPRVPYRESKLTRILQDSLGGTSRALMVACLNPGLYLEAVHTVSLAARSRHIGNYVVHKPETTPKVKVDMEAKLQAWLESKGKTKSMRITNGPRSPFPVNTPASASRSTTRKPNGNKPVSSTSEFNGSRFYKWSAPRKLFDSTATILASNNEKPLQTEASRDLESSLSKESRNGSVLDGVLLTKSNECNHLDPVFSPITKQKEVLDLCHKNTGSVSPSIHGKESPLRKVLSPVNSNIVQSELSLLNEGDCFRPMDTETPKTPSARNHGCRESRVTGTPLDKLNSLGSNIKDSLAKEYLAFLNVASKEELLALKGIGHKRAEYICELRESTPQPFKSLADLENIGLSSKQAHDLLRKAAGGIFS